jgi:hypothetical protein
MGMPWHPSIPIILSSPAEWPTNASSLSLNQTRMRLGRLRFLNCAVMHGFPHNGFPAGQYPTLCIPIANCFLKSWRMGSALEVLDLASRLPREVDTLSMTGDAALKRIAEINVKLLA